MVALVASQLRGPAARGRLRRARRRRRRRHRGGADPRRLGDHRAELAGRVRRRGRGVGGHPARFGDDPRPAAPGRARTAGLVRRRSLRARARVDGDGRARGEQLGLGAPEKLARRTVRVLAGAVRDRGGRAAGVGLRRVGALPRAAWPRRAAAPAAARQPHDALRPGDDARPEPDPDGDLLHGAVVPADRAGARRAGNGRADAARIRRVVHQRDRGLGAGQAVPRQAARARRAADRARGDAAAARHDRAGTGQQPPS